MIVLVWLGSGTSQLRVGTRNFFIRIKQITFFRKNYISKNNIRVERNPASNIQTDDRLARAVYRYVEFGRLPTAYQGQYPLTKGRILFF